MSLSENRHPLFRDMRAGKNPETDGFVEVRGRRKAPPWSADQSVIQFD
jgi:hypothetical protein